MNKHIFFAVYVAANLGLVLYGVLAMAKPGILLDPFLLNVYQFPPQASKAIVYLESLFRLLGFFNLVLGLLGLFFLRRLRISWQAWILRTVVLSTTFAYIGPIVFDNTVGNIGFFEIVEHFLFALVVILGVIFWRERHDE